MLGFFNFHFFYFDMNNIILTVKTYVQTLIYFVKLFEPLCINYIIRVQWHVTISVFFFFLLIILILVKTEKFILGWKKTKLGTLKNIFPNFLQLRNYLFFLPWNFKFYFIQVSAITIMPSFDKINSSQFYLL